jgi:hypothetical protein
MVAGTMSHDNRNSGDSELFRHSAPETLWDLREIHGAWMSVLRDIQLVCLTELTSAMDCGPHRLRSER